MSDTRKPQRGTEAARSPATQDVSGTVAASLIRAVESGVDPIIAVDRGGRIVYCNPASEAVFGYTTSELLGEPIDMLLPEPARSDHAQHISDFATGPDPSRRMDRRPRVRGRRKDGSLFLAAVSITKTDGPGGPLLVANVRDQTEEVALREAQRTAETRFRTLVDQAADGVTIQDADGRYLYLNAAGEALFGRTAAEVKQQTATTFLERGEMQSTSNGDGSRTIRAHVIRPDGTRVPVEERAVSLDDGSVISIIRDMSAWMAAQEALRDSEARLKRAQSLTRIGSSDWQRSTDVTMWSDEVWRIFGLDPADVIPTAEVWLERVHPEDASDREAIAVAAIASQAPGYEQAYRIVRLDGEVRHVEVVADLQYDATGQLSRRTGTMQDVTARVRADEAIRASEARLSRARRMARLGFMEWSPRTGTMTWSDEVWEIVGLDPAEHVASKELWEECVHPDDRRERLTQQERSWTAREPSTWRSYRILRPDGTERFLENTSEVQYDDSGEVISVSAVLHDVTDRVQAVLLAEERGELFRMQVGARESDRLAAADELHDGPAQNLAGAAMLVEAVRDSLQAPNGGREQELLQKVQTQIEVALDGIRRIMLQLRPATLDDLGLVGAVRDLAGATMRSTSLQVTCFLEPLGAPIDNSKALAVYRIAQEAVAKVLNHSSATSLTFRLSSAAGELILTIDDNGPRLDPEIRLGAGGRVRALELAQMRARAEAFGGTVAESEAPGTGTRIEIRVPL